MKKKPKVGWGILEPDPELLPETLVIIEQMKTLSGGQRDALLSRAVRRYLFVEESLDVNDGQEPDESQMVSCSCAISNFWFDILGNP